MQCLCARPRWMYLRHSEGDRLEPLVQDKTSSSSSANINRYDGSTKWPNQATLNIGSWNQSLTFLALMICSNVLEKPTHGMGCAIIKLEISWKMTWRLETEYCFITPTVRLPGSPAMPKSHAKHIPMHLNSIKWVITSTQRQQKKSLVGLMWILNLFGKLRFYPSRTWESTLNSSVWKYFKKAPDYPLHL